MKHRIIIIMFMGIYFVGLNTYAVPATGITPGSDPQLEKVNDIFKRNCITCHGGPAPAQELNLEPGNLFTSAVNVDSMQKTDLKIIDTANPGNSYLLMKIKGDKQITGKQMPLKKEPLGEEEIKTVESWISSLQGNEGETTGRGTPHPKPAKDAFWGTRLINLVTPSVIPRGHFLFRVTHRFVPSAKEGYKYFYGFDGPAVVFISMGWGITRNLDFTVGRSNLYQEWEFMLKWRFLSPANASALPLSMALHTGVDWVTRTAPGETVFEGNRFKYNIQLSIAYSLTRNISLLLVPGYSSDVNHFNPDPEGTTAIGTGLDIKLTPNLAIICEWVPVLSGYKGTANGWGAGIQYKIGKHLFQVFALNSVGITTDQFMAGGDLRLKKGDFRFGFSIYREL